MRREYDFSKAKRARDVPHLAKIHAAAKAGAVITTPSKTNASDAIESSADIVSIISKSEAEPDS